MLLLFAPAVFRFRLRSLVRAAFEGTSSERADSGEDAVQGGGERRGGVEGKSVGEDGVLSEEDEGNFTTSIGAAALFIAPLKDRNVFAEDFYP